jgi:cysteine-rich repeat protein
VTDPDDSITMGTEVCDDGNLLPGDGCFGSAIETGWTCKQDIVLKSHCTRICGNGKVDQSWEVCDDYNENPGDGCSFNCTVEDGWGCVEKAPLFTSVCYLRPTAEMKPSKNANAENVFYVKFNTAMDTSIDLKTVTKLGITGPLEPYEFNYEIVWIDPYRCELKILDLDAMDYNMENM